MVHSKDNVPLFNILTFVRKKNICLNEISDINTKVFKRIILYTDRVIVEVSYYSSKYRE